MIKSLTRPLKHARPIAEEDVTRVRFRRQWAIYPETEPCMLNWPQLPLCCGMVFRYHPDLIVNAVSTEGEGVLIAGLALRPSTTYEPMDSLLTRLSEANDEEFARIVISLIGVYVVVRYSLPSISVWTDPAGMMNVFYNPPYAASTPALIPGLMRDEALDAEYQLRGCDDWYTGSLCPFIGVKALLANHRLDVLTGHRERFWPCTTIPQLSASEAIGQAAQLLERDALAHLGSRTLLASLTGGRDTRVNLAALRKHLDDVEFFTIDGKLINPNDVRCASALAEFAGINHRIVNAGEAPPWLRKLYDEMTCGLSMGPRRDIIDGCNQVASDKYTHLNGNLGAIAIAFFSHSSNPQEVRISSLAKEFCNKSPAILNGLREWADSLPDIDPASAYNLMLLEQRGGRWMGIGDTASCLFFESATLFASRELFDVVSGAPYQLQRSHEIHSEILRVLWPELLQIPFCGGTNVVGRLIPKSMKEYARRILGRRVY